MTLKLWWLIATTLALSIEIANILRLLDMAQKLGG